MSTRVEEIANCIRFWRCNVCSYVNNSSVQYCRICSNPHSTVLENNSSRLPQRMSLKGQTRRAYLVSGFVREHTPNIFPIDVIQTCLIFYENVYYWTLTADQLHKLTSCEQGKSFSIGKFTYNNTFTFKLKISPPTSLSTGTFSRKVSLLLYTSNTWFNKLHILFEFYCEELHSQFKSTKMFKDVGSVVNAKQSKGLFSTHLYGQLKHRKTVTFSCCIDILYADYKMHFDSWFMIKEIRFKPPFEYEWTLNPAMLNQLCKNWINASRNCIYYQDNDDQEYFTTWRLCIQSHGNVGIALLRWPSLVETKRECWNSIDGNAIFIVSYTLKYERVLKFNVAKLQFSLNKANQYRAFLPTDGDVNIAKMVTHDGITSVLSCDIKVIINVN
eukprot:303757_1